MHAGDQLIKIGKGPILWVNVAIIADIIAKVFLR